MNTLPEKWANDINRKFTELQMASKYVKHSLTSLKSIINKIKNKIF